MIKCIGTKRDAKGRVLGYYLVDKNKFKRYIEKNKLKALIGAGKLQVANLTLTSDNRLVFKDIKGKAENANQQREVTPKKSLKEIVLACGEEGYNHAGLHYFIENRKVVVEARYGEKLQVAKILKGTEVIATFGFVNQDYLKTIIIPDSVTSIGHGAFCDCKNLTTIEIPNSIRNINNAVFKDCSSLTSITIPDSVITIGAGAFWGCSSLTNITIPEGVLVIEISAFEGCTNLINASIPDSIAVIRDCAFYECERLKEVKLPKRYKGRTQQIFDREDINFDFY